MKISITGQNGFIGSHLFNYFSYKRDDIEIIDFKKSFFNNYTSLDRVLSSVDVIIHLAGINRSEDDNYIFEQNLKLTETLIESIKRTNFKGKLIFASSIQEKLSSAYGKSKKESTQKFIKASKKNNFKFASLLIPNVFGPFCKPYYNSFIATFCTNIIKNKKTNIVDSEIKLIYIDSLIKNIESAINNKKTVISVKEDITVKVSKTYELLQEFRLQYFDEGIIPKLDSEFKVNLFNTFISYIPLETFYPRKHILNEDPRGTFAEVIKTNINGQFSYSTTKTGIQRGNHFHTRKIERFSVISGNAIIELRRIGSKIKYVYELNGDEPSYVDMPIWHTHNIKNTGKKKLITLFWINEFYNHEDPDTFFEKV
ncbi:MAG: NAD-dependent epimerase/dehydratase family protein [Cytophagales bacterium]